MNDASPKNNPPLELQPEAILESYRNWMMRAEEIHRVMVGAMQNTQDSGWDFAVKMAQCNEPERAMKLCNDWLNERRDAFFEDGRRLYELMFKMWSINIVPPGLKRPDRD